jgi:hypothetical protein
VVLEVDLVGAGAEEEDEVLVVAAAIVVVEADGSGRGGCDCFTAIDDDGGAGTVGVGTAEGGGGGGGVGREEGLVVVVTGREEGAGVVDGGAAGVTEVGFCTQKRRGCLLVPIPVFPFSIPHTQIPYYQGLLGVDKPLILCIIGQ